MVRYVFVQIGEDQQQFEHAVALIGIGRLRPFFQIVDDGQGVGQQPFERLGIDGLSGPAILKGSVGAHKGLVQEVVEAKLFRGESARDCLAACLSPTPHCPPEVHVTPQSS
jgi:hypothetical protein